MSYIPMSYQNINLIVGDNTPQGIKGKNNHSYEYFERALFQRALSVIKIKGLPDTLPDGSPDFLSYCLFRFGYVAFFNQSEYGTIFQPCTLSGYNVMYQPTNVLISNPVLPSLDLVIGQKTELLKLTPDYCGIWDIISYYAGKLALIDSAITQSLINSRFAYVLRGKNKAAAQAVKKLMDKIAGGEPTVVLDNVLSDNLKTDESPIELISRQDIKQGYLTTDLLNDYRTLLYDFDTEIGIPTLPVEKKERMVVDEVAGKTLDATSRSRIWVDSLTRSAEKVNTMFNLELEFELNFDMLKGGVGIGNSDNMGDLRTEQ